MGYQVYEIDGRFCGYGVPSICDFPSCNKEIDRGMAYCCGGDPNSETGCHQYFCDNHLFYGSHDGCLCERCMHEEASFKKKPDTKEWMNHMLTDDSWKEWRDRNEKKVKDLEIALHSPSVK